jgi:hypothetical protein
MVAAAWWQVRKLESFTQNHPRRHDAPPGPDLAERELAVWRAVHATLSTLPPLIEAAREVVRQIGINDFRDSHGHDAIMLRAYTELKRALSTFPAPASQWRPYIEFPNDDASKFDFWLEWADGVGGSCPPLGKTKWADAQRFRGRNKCWSSLYKATFFMPLPAPPATSDGGEG